jgi:hypothetical protein
MNLGDRVIYEGCAYLLRGLDPMSVPRRLAQLEDLATGEIVSAPFDELEPDDPGPPGFDPAA